MRLDNNSKRLGIFFFYDKDGIVDDYVSYLLTDLVKSLERLVIVCNGTLTSDGRKKFASFTNDLIVRENKGLDVWAYKTAIDFLGWNKLEKYDEVVLLNSTIMGPVYPFSEMFSAMNLLDLDFWGITKYGEESFDPFGCNPYGYVPEHIQSHFIVFRKHIVSSVDFQAFWNQMPMIETYQQSVGLFESTLTKYFADKGFSWDVYVNTEEYRNIATFPLIHYPKELIRDQKCPIFKRRQFFQEYDYAVGNTLGQAGIELYEYLRETRLYDVNLIWDNLLRTCHQSDLVKNLHLNYILPTDYTHAKDVQQLLKTKKVALVMHLYFEDLIEDSFAWASKMPEEADIYITTDTEEKKDKIEAVFCKLVCNHLEVRKIENRGRDVSSLLVGVKDIIGQYDIACFVHDKKTAQIAPGSVGVSFAYKCFKNTLYNRNFIYNIIETFDKNPRLGILSPPMPNHADYFPLLCNEWGPNFDATRHLAEQLNITVPMSPEKEPIAPFGTFFWFRPKALEPLLKKGWEYTDFPPEPNHIDGTLLHAVERLYPFAVQQAGYYPGVCMADACAEIEYTNLLHYVRGYNRILEKNGIFGYYHNMRDAIGSMDAGYKQKCEHFELLAAELYPKTSLKYQLMDRFKKLLHIK